MKRILPFLLAAFCSVLARAAVVNFRLMDESGTNALRTSVRFTSLTNPQQSGTNVFALRDFVRANTNLPLAISLHTGRWRVTVGNLSWTIAVPDTNAVLEAATLADAGLVTYTYTNPLPYYVATASGGGSDGSLWDSEGGALYPASSIWVLSGDSMYPSGASGSESGWTSTGTSIYPQ